MRLIIPIKQPLGSKIAGNQGWNDYSLTGSRGGNETAEVRCSERGKEDERYCTQIIAVLCLPRPFSACLCMYNAALDNRVNAGGFM